MQVLQTDINGFPQAWISKEDAASYYATDSVMWTVGDVLTTLRGGVNAKSGRQSSIDVHPIIAVNGASRVNLFDAVPTLTNRSLFRRDRMTCYLCASHHPDGRGLTRDHIVARSRGGADSWLNVCACCVSCNARKKNLTLEEAGMEMLFAPYIPSVFEGFLLHGRNVRGDVHEWLASRVGKHSRWYNAGP